MITWASRLLLILSINAANVVDLPLPVGPVTRINPRFFSYRSTTDSGMPRDSAEGISVPTRRIAIATEPLCLYAFRRNLPISGMEKDISYSPSSSNLSRWVSFIMPERSSMVSAGSIRPKGMETNSPFTRIFGGIPTVTCTSDAPSFFAYSNISLIVGAILSFLSGGHCHIFRFIYIKALFFQGSHVHNMSVIHGFHDIHNFHVTIDKFISQINDAVIFKA